MMTLEQEILAIVNQIPAAIEKAFMDVFILRHPGHANQKTHGNRFGSGQAKESLRRLKDDKGAREKYKQTARGKKAKAKSVFSPVNVLNRRRAAAIDYATMQQRRGDTQGHKQTLREIADIESKIKGLGGKVKF